MNKDSVAADDLTIAGTEDPSYRMRAEEERQVAKYTIRVSPAPIGIRSS